MTSIRYNPLTFSEKLKLAGMNAELAKVIAQEQAEIISNITNNEMATKNDISIISKSISSLENEIKSLEHRMTIKFGGIMLAGVGLLAFILKF